MDKAYARQFGREFLAKHPQFKDEVNDLYRLMLDEIEEGGSENHEVGLFIGSCEDLLN
jgi:hypothetical protein